MTAPSPQGGPPEARQLLAAVARPIQAFFRLEAASGLVLLACALAALAWANLGAPGTHRAVFDLPISLGAGGAAVRFTLHQLVNDGLMTLFFFLVGMEIKRELAVGELKQPAQAALPLVAALGGMALPAGIFLAFNRGGPGQAGWGVPVATDIAFCIGVLTLLRRRVPHALVVFVTALAIFDDVGGILVIALFYSAGIDPAWLALAAAVAAGAFAMGRLRIGSGAAWAAAGALLWWALHGAGIHATLSGVVLGLAVPARAPPGARAALAALAAQAASLLRRPAGEDLDGEALQPIEARLAELEAPLGRFEAALHPWVAFGIMPLFALANSGVDLRGVEAARLAGPVAVGIALGLLVGKAVGIFAFAASMVRLGLAPMPGGASYPKLLGVSTMAGIGFTVALFIAGLAYQGDPALLDQAKVGILGGSLAAGVLGAVLLLFTRRSGPPGAERSADPTAPG